MPVCPWSAAELLVGCSLRCFCGQQRVQGGDGGADVQFGVCEHVQQQSACGGGEQDRQRGWRQVSGDGAALLLGADQPAQELPVLALQPRLYAHAAPDHAPTRAWPPSSPPASPGRPRRGPARCWPPSSARPASSAAGAPRRCSAPTAHRSRPPASGDGAQLTVALVLAAGVTTVAGATGRPVTTSSRSA